MSETVTEAVPMPSVPLPPAALRLENLELDPNGNPYYKFPPFLSPPDGVKLIPFHKFKPSGIQITLGEEEQELDGEGIPTVTLGIKHEATDEKKKKKKKSKKDGDEPRKFSPWWDEWAEGEDLRRADSYDPNTPRTDRFLEGASQFPQHRKWTPALQSLYDHFRHYVGLLASPTKHKFGKGAHAENADDDDEDDEAELKAEQAQEEQPTEMNPLPESAIDADPTEDEPRIQEVDEEYQRRLEDEREAREMRIDAFLNDPEQSIKVFFSSFYKDKGLFWSEPKLRDGPILLSFFLSFFIRNRIMPDYAKALLKAHRVADQARLELPQTTKISMAIPDTFGRACTALWGTKQPQAWTGLATMDVDEGAASEPVKEWEEQLSASGVENVQVDLDAAVDAEYSGWGASEPMEGVEGWGDGATGIRDESNPWGAAPAAEEDWGAGEVEPSLLSVLGPTTIPLTHDVRLAEKSARQIVSFAPPNPGAKGLESTLGTVLLAPWKRYSENGTIRPPELVTERPEGSTFDPAKHVIQAFVGAETIAVLREGMALSAIFVQVVENEKENEPKDKKKSKSRSKGKGKAKSGDDKEWWYIEFLFEVLPSFWEEGDLD